MGWLSGSTGPVDSTEGFLHVLTCLAFRHPDTLKMGKYVTLIAVVKSLDE